MKVILVFLFFCSVLRLIKPSNDYGRGSNYYCPALNRPALITSGLTMDSLEGNDRDLLQYLQSDRNGKDCFNTSGGITCNYDHSDYDPYNGHHMTYKSDRYDGCNCDRDCAKYPEPRACYYRFVIEQFTAMGPGCRNCSFGNTSNCYYHQCIIGDGREKTVNVVNRMYPGPTIRVCQYDLIIVDAINNMPSDAITLHWHGMLQEATPYMDGTPYVAQCPTPPNGQFRYKFNATTDGTLWWHTHTGNIQRDGVKGALIVKLPRYKEPKYFDYDYDLACHTIQIDDWQEEIFDYQFPGFNRNSSHIPIKSEGYVINGQGSFDDNKTVTNTPHAQFHVKCGKKYRFRVIGFTTINCDYQLAIEDHIMKVIALDGNAIEPIYMTSLTMGSGERSDFILETKSCEEIRNSGRCSYHMAVRTTPLGDCVNLTLPQTAYLVYDCCEPMPTNTLNLTNIFEGPSFEYVEAGCNRTDVTCSAECRSPTLPSDPRLYYGGYCERRIFFIIGTYAYKWEELFNNSMNARYQQYYQPVGGFPKPNEGVFVDYLSNITSLLPPAPLYSEPFPIPENMLCSNDCTQPLCSCVNLIKLKYNSCVEIVFVDELDEPHPFHIHGHKWYVLKQGSQEERNQPNYWLNIEKTDYPARRDMITVPPMGYTVTRFIADNPGFWLIHCHFQNHIANGMFAIFQVGERSQFPEVPENFPTCGPYLPPAPEVCQLSKRCPPKRDNYPYANMSASEMCASPSGQHMRRKYS